MECVRIIAIEPTVMNEISFNPSEFVIIHLCGDLLERDSHNLFQQTIEFLWLFLYHKCVRVTERTGSFQVEKFAIHYRQRKTATSYKITQLRPI